MSVMTTVGGYRVTNAEEFDTVMESYFGSQDEFDYINRFFGCQSWTGHPMPSSTFHRDTISPEDNSEDSPVATRTAKLPLLIQKTTRLFRRRRKSSSSSHVSTKNKHVSLAELPINGAGQIPSSLPNLTIAKRGQSLRGCKGQLKPSPSETNSLVQPEDESNDAPEHPIGIDVTDGDMFTILYPYTPVESDELAITPGDKVRVLRTFSDGWAFVQRVDDSKIGAIPAVCLDTGP
ncbi:hypothetical protein IWW36_004053 [Coemansia brasiliensis]|uniref:SH3 domain-containing protein n=1 Tax=Coemansia brasiliensis TaxID=2650707 RepID=A0A9W8I461_9FUNG|nr:hypothetical protein IWW36_004053 [Coemansia brasiliensis]